VCPLPTAITSCMPGGEGDLTLPILWGTSQPGEHQQPWGREGRDVEAQGCGPRSQNQGAGQTSES
jgi:hypothetical protein